jgi:hypothetical protein
MGVPVVSIFTRRFWASALDRAVRSAAQSFALALGGEAFNVMQANWHNLAGFAGGGFVLSLLNSLAVRPPEAGGTSLAPIDAPRHRA